jgi:hypothetical protein
MSLVVCGVHPSVHAAHQASAEEIGVSVTSVYNKINGIEPSINGELVNPFGEFKIINSKFKIEEINGDKTIQNYQFKIQNYFFFILHFAFCILNSRRGLTTNLRPSNQRL